MHGSRCYLALSDPYQKVIYRAIAAFLTLSALSGPSPAGHSRQAVGLHLDRSRQSVRRSIDLGNSAGDQKELCLLEPGQSIKRELASGERHHYRVWLNPGQFLKVIIEQQGIDIEALASGPDGKQVLVFDSESRPRGQEAVLQVAETAGDHRLVVQPKQNGTTAGSYEIRIEELREATEDDRALQDARKLYQESLELQRAGNYNEALPLLESALRVRERILGPEHPEVATALNSLGVIYWRKGEPAKAERLYRQALAIREAALGPEHPMVAASINNLGILYMDRGEQAESETLFRRALSIWEKALGPEHLKVATGLNNLAACYQGKGDNAQAEPLYQRALAIHEKASGRDAPEVARVLANLANLYQDRGDYVQPISLYQRALAIWEKQVGPEHPEVADVLTSFGSLYWRRGEDATAESFYRRALTIKEKMLGPEHWSVADTLNGLAIVYHTRGVYEQAVSFYQSTLAIREKTLGPEHPFVAYTLNGLAQLYRDWGDYLKAEPLFHRALAIREKVLGPEHPDVGGTLNNLAMLYAATGDTARAIAFQARADAVSEHNLELNLAIGSERQKLAYLATLSKQTDQTISLHLRSAPDDPVARNLAVTLILQRKGRALDATSQNLSALRNRFNPQDQALLDRWIEARSQIARLVFGGSRGMTADQYQARVKSLEDQAEKDEAQISRQSAEFRVQSLPVTLADVQAAIPADAALIEFAAYHPFNAKVTGGEAYGPLHYVAYVLRRNGEIQWKELGAAKPIDQAIAALREALRNPNHNQVMELARSADMQIFQPVRPLLGEQARLLISPDGPLNLIPFAALVDEQGRYLVERYSISYLTSGRDLLRLQVARKSQNPSLVIAAPDFGEPKEVETAPSWKLNRSTSENQLANEPVEVSAGSAFNRFSFSPLPYAAQEGEALCALLSDATLLTKRQATKAALSLARSPRILHIATHGFFLEDLELTPTGGSGYRAFDDDPERLLNRVEGGGLHIESPLLRSGLALAGANEHLGEDNGILTALEVTGLNLWGTKLVVLSACDTGVGEVRNGDGVHGLRRALVLAGAETQVMSLWTISDKVTRDLMVAYYRKLNRGEERGEALRQAQLEMLKQVKRRHPYYWASFIQSGAWTSLDGRR